MSWLRRDGQGSSLREALQHTAIASAIGILTTLPMSSVSNAADELQWKRAEVKQPEASSQAFAAPSSTQPVWLPKRPAAQVSISDDEPAPVTTPRTAAKPVTQQISDNDVLEPVPAGAHVEESPTPATIRTAAHWQSGLKWRLRHPEEFAASKEMRGSTLRQSTYYDAAKVSYTDAAHLEGESKFIRKANQIEQTNPFKDPFGDGQNPPPATQAPKMNDNQFNQPVPPANQNQFNPAPQPNNNLFNPAPALNNQNQFNPAPSIPGPMNPAPMNPAPLPNNQFNSPAPDEPLRPRLPMNDLQQPDTRPSSERGGAGFNELRPPDPVPNIARPSGTCNRVYNDRDCCEEDAKRTFIRGKLKEQALARISLDITPSFKPDSKSRRDDEKKRRGQLETAPVKTWKNRAGEVLVTGRMVDFYNSRVVVVQEDGEKKRVPYQELSDDDLCFVSAWWGLPTEFALGDDPYVPRDWVPSTMTWKASALCNKPLYFEETQLERYGHTTGPISQPFVSGAHFFLNIAALPYNMAINPPGECQYPLGYYRPGSCAPWLLPPIPISLKGALAEAGVIVGGVYVLP